VRLLLLFALFAAIGLVACQRDAVPPLVEVKELAPRVVEVGERLEIAGTGFPQGLPARVTFDGVLHRAGEPDARASIDADGVVVTNERLEIAFRDALEEAFCGHGDRAAHATFVGDVEVAFASKAPGAPPLTGILRGVSLDVRPVSVGAAVVDARAIEGGRVLDFVGLVKTTPSGRGLLIDEVRSGSIAEAAGIRAGDTVVAVDGVHALGLEDVLPASSREVHLGIRHGDEEGEETKTLSMTGFAGRRIPRELEPALLVIALALTALLLFVVPGPALLTRIEIGLAARLRARSGTAVLREALGGHAEAAAAILTSAVLATFALGAHVLGGDLDAVALLVTCVSLLVASRTAEVRGALATIRTMGDAVVCLLVLVLALVELAVLGGAVHLAELVRSQGGAPWEFAAAQKPAAAILSCTFAASLVALMRVRVSKPSRRRRVFERIGLLCASALAVAAFFGGWQLPGVVEARGGGLLAASAALFVLKTWVFAVVVSGIAGLASAWTIADARVFATKKLAPALAVAAIAVMASRRLVPGAAVENAFGAAATAVFVLLLLRSAGRVRSALARREPHASPFL